MKGLRLFAVVLVVTITAVACQPQVVEVTREVVEKVEVVEQVEVEVEKEVVQEVEKIVEVEVPAEIGNRGVFRISHGLGWGGTENLDPVNPSPLLIANRMIYDRLATLSPDGVPVVTGEICLIDSLDMGGYRLGNNDIETGITFSNAFSVKVDDPLSAKCEYESTFELGRGEWRTKVKNRSVLTADLTHFHLTSTVHAYEGETEVFTKRWTTQIARDLV